MATGIMMYLSVVWSMATGIMMYLSVVWSMATGMMMYCRAVSVSFLEHGNRNNDVLPC
jgi:hypothetical protein